MPRDEWGLDPQWEEKLKRFIALSEPYAQAKAELANLENVKRTILAQAKKDSGEKTDAAQNREADVSDHYKQWCMEVREATYNFEKMRLQMRALELWFEMVRTEAATKREIMKQGG